MWLMKVVQCSQPAARSLAGHQVNGAISRAQDWCLLMAYCHSTSAIARPTLVMKAHVIESHTSHLGHFVHEPRNDQGKILVALQRTAHLIYLIIKILCWGHILVIRYRTHLHIFCQFCDIYLCTLFPNTFLDNFSILLPNPQPSSQVIGCSPMSQYAIIHLAVFLLRKMHNHRDKYPSSLSFWVVPERGYGTAAVTSWWDVHNVQNNV